MTMQELKAAIAAQETKTANRRRRRGRRGRR